MSRSVFALLGRAIGWLLVGPTMFEPIDFDGLDLAIAEQAQSMGMPRIQGGNAEGGRGRHGLAHRAVTHRPSDFPPRAQKPADRPF